MRGGGSGVIPLGGAIPLPYPMPAGADPAYRCEHETDLGSKCPDDPDQLTMGCESPPVSRRKTAEAVLDRMAA